MTINLTELEELARKAIDAWPKQAVRCSLPGSVPTDVVNLWCVSSPSTVLALCKVVRAAEYLANEARGWGEYGELLDCVTNRKCLADAVSRVKETIAELEGT